MLRIENIPAIIQVFLISLIANCGLLLVTGVFWDDWILINLTDKQILDMFEQHGAMFNLYGYLESTLKYITPYQGRYITVLLSAISSLLVYKILLRCNFIKKEDARMIAILYAVAPFFFAKITYIVLFYTLCNLLFFLAWYLIKIRIIALLFFFISFNTNSFLVFYILPLLYLLLIEENIRKFKPKLIASAILKNLDFISLPIIYFYVKNKYYSPYGIYSGYNENFDLKLIIPTYINTVTDFLIFQGIGIFLLVPILIGILFNNRKKNDNNITNLGKNYLKLSLITLLIGVFPYAILGLVPTWQDWNSRHQLLLPIGFSLLIMGLISIINNDRIKRVIFGIVVINCILINWSFYFELYRDNSKQFQMIEWVKKQNFDSSSRVFNITDLAKGYNAFDRNIRFYEWNAILNINSSGQYNIGFEDLDIVKFNSGFYDSYYTKYYNADNFKRNKNLNFICLTIKKDIPQNLWQKIQFNFLPNFLFKASNCFLDNHEKQ